jgi:hypothetical protein
MDHNSKGRENAQKLIRNQGQVSESSTAEPHRNKTAV